MDLRRLDLNLLPVLDALLRHRSVTLAARELDLRQPSVSAALARLRVLLGDELFVRTGRGLRPTSRAAALAAPVADIMARVRDEVLPQGGFDPGSSRREFRLAHTDVGAYVLWPRIFQAVRRKAPGVRLQLRVLPAHDLPEALAEGAVDLAVGAFSHMPPTLFQRRLYERHFVGMVSATHPMAGCEAWSLQQFAQVPQLAVRGSGRIHEAIDRVLAQSGLERGTLLELPSYLMLSPMLLQGEFLAVLPGQLADAYVKQGSFVAFALPFTLPPSSICMHWHRRLHDDAGLQWLRGVIVEEVG